MHELGHGLGLRHITSSDSEFLMESSIKSSFDGPQFDDILGLHHLYGDLLERSNGGLGNDTMATATSLGMLGVGNSRTLGVDALRGTVVDPSYVNYFSISNQSDSDYFSIRVDTPVDLDVLLMPAGPTYQFRDNDAFDSSAIADLSLQVLNSAGEVIADLDQTVTGLPEFRRGVQLYEPGEYFVRVAGNYHLAQFYALHLETDHPYQENPDGDYNDDGVVNLADTTLWRDSLNATGANLVADGSNNDLISDYDYKIWRWNYGAGSSLTLPGDFNADGVVDMADFTVWRNSQGQVGFDLAADADSNYRVDHADYDLWRASFGRGGIQASLGGSALPTANVPEPSALLLLLAAAPFAAARFK